MAFMLGKRKRTSRTKDTETDKDSKPQPQELDAQEIFRRHFEAQFEPLPVIPDVEARSNDIIDGDESDGSMWDGISDEAEAYAVEAVEVVQHTDSHLRMVPISKAELKVFMSSKIPQASSSVFSINNNSTTPTVADDDDASEAANIKKDLALQRLLTESHLLDSAEKLTSSGIKRHKATDIRIQALGAKSSLLKQAKMPLAHRKGIIAKQKEREEARRKEAKENGIILERVKMKSRKTTEERRERGVGAPGVGRFAGGTLKLSKRDIFSIEGPKKNGFRSRGGRGSSGGRGRGRGKRER